MTKINSEYDRFQALVAARIMDVMEQRKITTAALREKTKLPIDRLLDGDQDFSLKDIIKICVALDVDFDLKTQA